MEDKASRKNEHAGYRGLIKLASTKICSLKSIGSQSILIILFVIPLLCTVLLSSCTPTQNTPEQSSITESTDAPVVTPPPTTTNYPTYTAYPTYTNFPTYTPQPVVVVTATFSPTPEFTPTNTNTPTITFTPTKSPTPTKTSTNTPTPHLTKTAQAIVNATKGANATATKSAYFARATQNAQYGEIKVKELITYPDKHKGEKVKVWGRVFNIIGNDGLQMWLEWTYESVYVIMANPFSDIYEDDQIIVYGTIQGEHCGTNVYGASICSPLINCDYYEFK